MPGKKDASQQRTTAAFKMKVLAEMEALVADGESMTAASKAVAAKYEAAAGGEPKPFSPRSAQGWLEKKAEIAEQASKEPAGGDAMHARPEQAADRALPTKARHVLQQRRYAESEEGKEVNRRCGHAASERDREDRLKRDVESESIETGMPIDEIWDISLTAAEDLLELILAHGEQLKRDGQHAAVYTGLASGRRFGGSSPTYGAPAVYDQGWGGYASSEDSPRVREYEEWRHFLDGDSLQRPGGGGGLSVEWCRENTIVLTVKLPNKSCLKVAEMILHTLIFRLIASGDMRSLIYQSLPDASYTGLLACETLISAGKTDIPGEGVLFATFVKGFIGEIDHTLELMQKHLGQPMPGDVDFESMMGRAVDWGERKQFTAKAGPSSEASALPPAARGDDVLFVLESRTSGGEKSLLGKYWAAKLDFEPWRVDGQPLGYVLTTEWGSGRGALRGVRRSRSLNTLFTSPEAAVREAWKQADAKLSQGRSKENGKSDRYELKVKMAPRRPEAPTPESKRPRR